jgi:3'-5' exoribonuclease
MKLSIKDSLSLTKGAKVSGVIYVKSFTYKTGSNNKPFATGSIGDQELVMGFKVWSDNLEKFKELADKKILMVEGTIDTWNGTVSVVFDKIQEDIFGYTPFDFLLGHNRHKIEEEFYEFVDTVLSPKAKSLVNHIIQGDVKERFFTEFAAKSMHDACPTGLANHTVKMLRLANTMIKNDARLKEFSDIIYIGVMFHDLGKIRELYMGDYVKNSFISHREYGCEMMYENKEFIYTLYDEDFFYRLLSVIREHHHVYEEKAKTIYAYIVHLIDMVDSQVTRMMDTLDSLQYNETSSGEKTIGHHGDIYYY